MATALHLIGRKPMTLEDANGTDENIINRWARDRALEQLYTDILAHKDTIKALIKHHLQLGPEDISITHAREWICGSFNMCIPIHVTSGQVCRKFMLRCPMPHKLAEAHYPGTVEEKMRCEVGAYVWMQDNCPDIRIPHLYGFGFSDYRHFTHEKQRPWYVRLARLFQRHLRGLLRYPSLSHYIANPTNHRLPTAYMLLEYIGPDVGKMLSHTWERHRDDPDPSRKQTLFRSMARVILSLARIPQPRIGSFLFHDNCTVTLTNRPLTATMIVFENDGTPRTMMDTYPCTESYVADMLTLHDNQFLNNRNATYDASDCRSLIAARTLLRVVSHHYIRSEQRRGPFILQFTDLHESNMFVDDEWNITCVMDLEWVCALPIEMLSAPYWLTGCFLNGIIGEKLDEFNKVREEFVHIFEQEEEEMKSEHGLSIARAMDDGWKSKSVWFWRCIDSVNAMFYLLDEHISPAFSVEFNEMHEVLWSLWRTDSASVVEKKVADYEKYRDDLQMLYKEKGEPVTEDEEKLDA